MVVHVVIILIAAIASVGCFYFVFHKPRIKKLRELSQAWLVEAMVPDAQNEVKYLYQLRDFFIGQLRGSSSEFDVNARLYLRNILTKDMTRMHHIHYEYYAYSKPAGLEKIITSAFGDFKKDIQVLLAEEFKAVKGTEKEADFMKKIKSPLFAQCDIVDHLILEKEFA